MPGEQEIAFSITGMEFEGSNSMQGMNAVGPAYSPPSMHTSKTWEEAR